ncbi:MAG: hypothetical protein IPL27_26745 [Lewinellaceae bacterium]|nr:hypothetical protein [Lewinellaceae bacterium]
MPAHAKGSIMKPGTAPLCFYISFQGVELQKQIPVEAGSAANGTYRSDEYFPVTVIVNITGGYTGR